MQVGIYQERDYFSPERLQILDRFAQFAVIAAREAVSDAQLCLSGELSSRTAVVTGSGMGGQHTEDAAFQQLYGKNSGRVHPFTIPRCMDCASASQIAMEFGIHGPVFSISTACASSAHALGQAFWMLRSGVVDFALAGGSEAPFSWASLKAWEALRVISPDTCRPFCKDRQGMILGEGGAMLLLENMESARARGIHIYGEIVGFGMSSDAQHITQPSAAGPAAAMRAALNDGRLPVEKIDYINAHGTGTQGNDRVEALAIRDVFGSHAGRVAVSSTKSMHGHTLGAAGALELFATIVALRDGVLPPTVNFTERDPECDLDVVANQPRRAPVAHALSNSFAFGGLNAVLAVAAPDAVP